MIMVTNKTSSSMASTNSSGRILNGSQTKLSDLNDQLQTDIYILAGVFGSLLFVVLCFVVYLTWVLHRLRRRMKNPVHKETSTYEVKERFTAHRLPRLNVGDRNSSSYLQQQKQQLQPLPVRNYDENEYTVPFY